MKRLKFTKTSNIQQSNDPNTIFLTFDENSVLTSSDNIGNRPSVGSLINTNRQTSSTYQLQLSDAGKLVEMNVGSTNSVTIPSNATASFTNGTQILLTQYGSGSTGITYSSPVVVRSTGDRLRLSNRYSAATLIKIGTDEWYLFGDITI